MKKISPISILCSIVVLLFVGMFASRLFEDMSLGARTAIVTTDTLQPPPDVQDGETLTWDAATETFVATPLPSGGGAVNDWTSTDGVITSFDANNWTDADDLGGLASLNSITVNSDGHLVLDVPRDVANRTGAFYNTPTGAGDFVAAFRVSIQSDLQADGNGVNTWEVLGVFAGGGAPIDLTANQWAGGGFGVNSSNVGNVAFQTREGNGTDFNTNAVNWVDIDIPATDFDIFLVRDAAGQELITYFSAGHDGGYQRGMDTNADADYAATGQVGLRIQQETLANEFKVIIKAFAPPGVLTNLP